MSHFLSCIVRSLGDEQVERRDDDKLQRLLANIEMIAPNPVANAIRSATGH